MTTLLAGKKVWLCCGSFCVNCASRSGFQATPIQSSLPEIMSVIAVDNVSDNVAVPALELVGADDNRILVVGILGRVAADGRPDVLWNDAHLVADVVERGGVGLGEREDHRIVIRGGDALVKWRYSIDVKCGVLLEQIEGEDDILAREWLAVAPFHALAEIERQLHIVVGELIAARQPGLGLARQSIDEPELLVHQARRAPFSTVVGVKVGVEEIDDGLAVSREHMQGLCSTAILRCLTGTGATSTGAQHHAQREQRYRVAPP